MGDGVCQQFHTQTAVCPGPFINTNVPGILFSRDRIRTVVLWVVATQISLLGLITKTVTVMTDVILFRLPHTLIGIAILPEQPIALLRLIRLILDVFLAQTVPVRRTVPQEPADLANALAPRLAVPVAGAIVQPAETYVASRQILKTWVLLIPVFIATEINFVQLAKITNGSDFIVLLLGLVQTEKLLSPELLTMTVDMLMDNAVIPHLLPLIP